MWEVRRKKFKHYDAISKMFKETDSNKLNNQIAMGSGQLGVIREEIEKFPLGNATASYIAKTNFPEPPPGVRVRNTCLNNISNRNFTDQEVMEVYTKCRSNDTDRDRFMRDFLKVRPDDRINADTVHYNTHLISGILRTMAVKRNTLKAQLSNAMMMSPVLEATPRTEGTTNTTMPWGGNK